MLPGLDTLTGPLALAAVLAIANAHRIPSVAAFLAMRVTLKNVALLLIFCSVWTVLSLGAKSAAGMRVGLAADVRGVIVRSALGAIPVLFFVAASHSGLFGLSQAALFLTLAGGTMLVVRLLVRIAGNVLAPALSPVRQCLIIGSGSRAVDLFRRMEDHRHGHYHVIGFVDEGGTHTHPEAAAGLLGNLDHLAEILKSSVVDEALIALPVKSCYEQIQSAIHVCELAGVRCKLPSEAFSYTIGRPRMTGGNGAPAVIALDVAPHDGRLMVKRGIDIAGAICGLAVLAAPMVAIAAAIKFTSRGPVIFKQRRYGLNKRMFTMYKFRTMRPDAEARQQELEHHNEMSGPVFKIRDDPRITRIGRFLRRTSLDELPQLWNVLTGTMSLVGPRPLPVRDVARFEDAWLMRRFSVKPGMTCLWQISGRNDVDFERWIELDLQYIDNWSLALDARILIDTVGVVLRGDGAA